MAELPQRLVEVGKHEGQGFKPVLNLDGWLVAASRHRDGASGATLRSVQRHHETDEVFVLTAGAADMIIMDGDDTPTDPYVFPMQRNVMYNVRQGVWHATVLSEDAHIVIFERSNTGPDNSTVYELPPATLEEIRRRLTLA